MDLKRTVASANLISPNAGDFYEAGFAGLPEHLHAHSVSSGEHVHVTPNGENEIRYLSGEAAADKRKCCAIFLLSPINSYRI